MKNNPNIMQDAILRYLNSPDYASFKTTNMAEALVIDTLKNCSPVDAASFFLKMIDVCQTY